MEWRTWIVFGLFLQMFSGVPGFLILWHPDPITFNQETGVITRIDEKLSRRERCLLAAGLALLLVGTMSQIVGACCSPLR
jgi:hypothetical protein